ncbi:MAG: hypothetical protein ACI32N_06610 [Bulleidia sp.]
MKQLHLILLVCIIIILLCTLILLVHSLKPAQYHPVMDVKQSRQDAFFNRFETEETLWNDREYTARWPQLVLAFTRISDLCQDALQWQGATRTQRRLLFVFRHEQSYSAFMSACEDIFENNLVPYNAFDVIHDPDCHITSEHLLYRMKKTGTAYTGVITDESGLFHLSGTSCQTAVIGSGYLSGMTIGLKGDNEEFDWLGEVRDRDLFHPIKDSDSVALYRMVKQTYGLHPEGMTFLSRVQDVMKTIPESTHWFMPVLEKHPDRIVLYGLNPKTVEAGFETLRKSAETAGITLTGTGTWKGYGTEEINTQLPERCTHALHKAGYDALSMPMRLPVPPDQQIHLGCPVLLFGPLMHENRTSYVMTMEYYRSFLLEGNIDRKAK